MPILSVITVACGGESAYLRETYESVAGQRLPPHWSVQWLVQEDSATSQLLDSLPDQPWISKGSQEAGGLGQSRSLALQRVEGVLTRVLDAGDLFPDESVLTRDIEALAAGPHLGWTLAPSLVLLPDRRFAPGPGNLPHGRLAPGFLAESLCTGSELVTGATATIYTELLLLHGGWPATTLFQDLSPLLTAEAVSDGWMQQEPGGAFRSHPSRQNPSFSQEYEDDRAQHLKVVLDRADAIRRLGWRW